MKNFTKLATALFTLRTFVLSCCMMLIVTGINAQNVPASGFSYLAPGTNTTIYDNGGSGSPYSNGCSGYMVLYNSSSTSTITLGGSTSGIETCCDYVRIYDGIGTGGTILQQITGSNTVSVTGAAGHCLTVYFYSDGSVTGNGFAISVTYSAGTPGGSTLVPTSGNNSVACGSSTVLYDAGGVNGAYGNGYNGYTVLNNQGSGVISLLIYTDGIETCCDYVKVYAGVGTGGTVLGTYTGTNNAISLTSSAGQPLTVQFFSDGSVTGQGFCIGVRYSGSCTVPYQSQWISMSVPSSWCAGETKNVTVTVKNNGSSTWTDASPDINIGCKWNADADYFVRVNAGGLAPGAQQTYTLSMTAPATAGSNNLTFDVVNEGNCWFGGNGGSCGPGNVTYVSSAVTIYAYPSAVTVSGGGGVCVSTTLTASGGSPGTMYWQGTTSGGTSTSTATTTQSVSSNGTYYFRANNGGCWGPEGSASVTINPLPGAVTVNTPGTYCGSTTLTATGGSGGTIYWQNTTNNGTSTTTPSTSQSVSSSGTYYFRARTAAGCWGTQGSAAVTIINNSLGENTCNPINAGTLCVGQTYTDTRNNGLYANDYGQSSGDIYYSFTLNYPATVNIGHCGSGFDTYITLLNSGGTALASNDDGGPLCSGNNASLSASLAAGTYYVVSEGYSTNTGNILTTITVASPTANATDAQNKQGIDSWLGQVYDGTAFNTFVGQVTEPAMFDETFGGDYNCYGFNYNNGSNTGTIYTETMSIRYRMTKDFPCGAYTFTAGSDDGIRLWVNGVLVIDQWIDRGYTTNSTSPIYLYGPTSLQLEYYEGGGGNRCSFTYSSSPVNILGSVNVTSTPATCGGNGTIVVTPSTGSATLWYNNDMNFYGPQRGTSTISGNTAYYYFNYNTPASKDSWMGLTTPGNNQNGSLVINNQYALNATSFRAEFDIYIGGGSGADGMSLSYAADVAAGGGCNGTGSGLRLVFDTYNNGGSPCQGVQNGNVGVGLFYGGFSLGQQYACNSMALRGAWRHCVFTVSSTGQAILYIDGINAFNQNLPAAYVNVTDKSAWKWAVTASTGGANDYHGIDNLMISAYDQYEYSANGSTWQSSTSFTKPAGSYTLYARNKSGECVSTLGTATIYDPTPPSPPSSPDVTVQICSNGSTGTISVNTPPTNVVTDWYSTPSGGSPIAGGTAVNSVTVTAGTYYAEARNTVTLCKSTTRTAISLTINPIPAAPTSGGNVSACNGTSGTLSATPPASPAGTIIDWYTTGGTLLSASSNTYTTSTAGTYVAVSQSPAGCSSNPGTNITLNVLGALNYGTVANTGETICNNGDPASFGFSTAPSGGTGSFSYQWYYKDGVNTAPTGTTFPNGWNIIGGATSNSYNPPAGLTTTRTYACGVDATGSPDCAPMTWAAGQWVVTVRPDAVATISGTTTVCLNSTAPTVTFSNSTALPITVTYNVNGGSNQTINIAASGTATVTQATSTAGTFAYNLVSAVFQSAPTCVNTLSGSATVTVRPAAVATVSGTTSVCLNDAAPSVTFNNSTALPITVTYNVNGGSNQTINVAASGTATVSQATGTAGAFAYNLVSAVFQTAPTCVNTLSGSATVTVRPAAIATISGTTTVCQNDAAPSVTFNNSTALPITVTYNVNGGSNQTVNVAASSTATVSQATTSAGSFAYNLVSAVFQTAPTCVNTLSGSATVTVRATPTATISGTTTVCQYDAPQTITFTNPLSLPVTVTYNVNGGSAQTINVAANGTATVSQVTTTDGAFAYNLVSVVYQNAPTCSNSLSGSATVTVRPKLDATISGNATVCQGSAAPNVTFNNPQALPITITYTVNGGSNQTINVPASSSATVAVSTATPGSFVYSIVSGSYQTAPNCPNSVGGVVTVVVQAPIVLTATATPNPVCYDGSLVLTSTVTQGTGITSWSWTGPGGFTASTQNTSRSNMHTGSSYEGIYYVSATNVCGASTPQPTASVVVHPEITANVVIDECASVGPDNYYMLVTAAGGVPDYTFNSATMVVSSDTAVYEVAAGNTDYFTITDASSCSIVVSGTAPTGHPTDIALSSTTGIKSVNCYEMGLNKWLSFRDDATNEVIMSINDNGQNLGQVNVTVYKEATEPATYTTGPNCQDFTDFKAMQRHFMVTTSNAPTGPVGVRLYFTAAEANALHAASIGNNIPGNSCTENDDFNDPTGLTDLYITKYTGADEDGDYTNNHAAGLYRVFGTANGMNTPDGPLTKGAGQFGNLFTGAQSHHYVELNVTEFSEFWASGSFHASALPVEMIYLEANAIDNSYIQLKWATAIEINNKGFQVERSLDGQTWNTIGWVDGYDNSTVQQNYTYNDMDVTGGVRYYYRLKQVDFDGAFEYTDLVSAIITQQSTFNVKDFVPNPTLNNTNLVVTSSVDQDIDVVFYNLLGEVVSSSKHSLHKGGNQINFSLSTLAAGTYTAVVTSNNEVYSKKIVVVK